MAYSACLGLTNECNTVGDITALEQSLTPDAQEQPWSLRYITANGYVLPCCISPWTAKDYAGLILGNALLEPVAEIWNGERYRALRTQFET
jgi:MoaA/NifB/PqqE/SkfB family radical SAM enzyme